MSKPELPLASWKTWWTPEIAETIAMSLHNHVDVTKLPRNGCILEKKEFRAEDLRDPHVAMVVEGLIKAYPIDKQPSGYLLGDAALAFNRILNYSILGPQETNPIKEKNRRDGALMEGGKMKKLLSYVRTSGLKSDVGRTCDVTYLKQLANHRVVRVNKKNGSSATSSTSSGSPAPSMASLDSPSTYLGFIFYDFHVWVNPDKRISLLDIREAVSLLGCVSQIWQQDLST